MKEDLLKRIKELKDLIELMMYNANNHISKHTSPNTFLLVLVNLYNTLVINQLLEIIILEAYWQKKTPNDIVSKEGKSESKKNANYSTFYLYCCTFLICIILTNCK